MAQTDVMRLFATWMLAHEQADELMKASVDRGRSGAAGMAGGPDAFTDGFMSMVAEEKERLKAELAGGTAGGADLDGDERLAEIRFEVAELRGRLDQMQATLDVIAAAVADRKA